MKFGKPEKSYEKKSGNPVICQIMFNKACLFKFFGLNQNYCCSQH